MITATIVDDEDGAIEVFKNMPQKIDEDDLSKMIQILKISPYKTNEYPLSN
ncbi:MAG TPA: hypothetical protein PK345_05390 [Bacteroidales bacterium]|jgi:hypothetical protein|nr:hypothetical protein [Bacteroidales bacterium]NLH33336.1 hypothetical protein [Lentimicrobium sp.]OQC38211.1 MAG: hypothetical protein BWX63_00498 [Bacteroidetes bacterium ADurb.Bin041]MBP7874700.1 hypothetical protein [Bacteroidales bacterium]MCZ2281863.1 hypothetical protein [Bacteroidales bacterium]